MGRPGLPSHLRREFWQQVRGGLSVEKAAAVSGVALCTARDWYRDSGGVNPFPVSPVSGRYLSFQEREEIAVGLAARLQPSEYCPPAGALYVYDQPRDRAKQYVCEVPQAKCWARATVPVSLSHKLLRKPADPKHRSWLVTLDFVAKFRQG